MHYNKHQSRSRRPLGFESLETRAVPAGNVTASVTNGALSIQGDAESNGVFIRQLKPTQPSAVWSGYRYEIAGYNVEPGGRFGPRTVEYNTINGQRSIIVEGVNAGVNISLGKGNDYLIIRGPDSGGGSSAKLAGDVRILAGDDDDRVVAYMENQKSVYVDMGRGADDFRTAGAVLNSIEVHTDPVPAEGAAATDKFEFATLTNVSARGSVKVFGGTGKDQISVAGGALQLRSGVQIDSFAGDDGIVLAGGSVNPPYGRVVGNASIRSGDGNDEIGVGSLSFMEKLTIEAGAGDDRIRLNWMESHILSVLAGVGKDIFVEFNHVTSVSTTFSGGEDDDASTQHDSSTSNFGDSIVTSIELLYGGEPLG